MKQYLISEVELRKLFWEGEDDKDMADFLKSKTPVEVIASGKMKSKMIRGELLDYSRLALVDKNYNETIIEPLAERYDLENKKVRILIEEIE